MWLYENPIQRGPQSGRAKIKKIIMGFLILA
jgi:hypothetical protein